MLTRNNQTNLALIKKSPINPVAYLYDLGSCRLDPVLKIEKEPFTQAIEYLGAKGISVPDSYEPYQISLDLYIGATTPFAKSEKPHWHAAQTEAYVLIEGQADLVVKYHWEREWQRYRGDSGDILVVQPNVCHWFQWRSERGLALVFKAPQIAGVGKYPNGKTDCFSCQHFNNGCVLPEGFTPDQIAET